MSEEQQNGCSSSDLQAVRMQVPAAANRRISESQRIHSLM